MTTDIFRRDEIFVIEKIDGESYCVALDVIPGMTNDTRLDIMYLEDRLFKGLRILGDREIHGIPVIKGKGQF